MLNYVKYLFAGQSSLDLSVMLQSIGAAVVHVSTMEPVFSILAHSLVTAFLVSLDRNVKQRLMHVTPTPATMVQLVAASLLIMSAHALVDSLAGTAPQGLTTVTTLHVIMAVLVPMV